ncbi:aminotransferase, class V superfamily domain protein [Mycobacterium xenopi 4042]|uniref:Aminotransferase, class V superfamily domain protein n=1 Tax=Mycobacterium xenopi 4042 TaxID=1299334 RepID=X8DDT1_MYCXE|nr:aminotransferase, class V superfamily domain protein [Mycobacterium xenopi 4042]
MRLAGDARRFDSWPAWFSLLGAGLSLAWLAALDRNAVQAHTVGLANRLRANWSSRQWIPRSSQSPSPSRLMRCKRRDPRSRTRGAVRVGFHLYNTEADLDRLLDAL